MTIQEWTNNNQLSIDIWNKKYRNEDESLDDWFNRITNNNELLIERIKQKKFLFAGRVLANRGILYGSYSNCYSSGYVEDSLDGIMNTAKDIALTFKSQGGQGISLSKIRPKGSKIGEKFISDGIIPFMEIFNTVTASISQGNSRRGALMISIDVNHPEAESFLTIKSNHDKINNANLSLEIDDEFMNVVELYYKTGEIKSIEFNNVYKGRDDIKYVLTPIKLYKLIIENAYKHAEPGILFTNQFRNYNLAEFDKEYVIETSNP